MPRTDYNGSSCARPSPDHLSAGESNKKHLKKIVNKKSNKKKETKNILAYRSYLKGKNTSAIGLALVP